MDEIVLSGPPTSFDASWIWSQFFGGPAQEAFSAAIGRAIATRRWFGAKTKTIRTLDLLDAIPLDPNVRVVLLQIEFTEGQGEVYQVPLALAAGAKAQQFLEDPRAPVWARVRWGDRQEAAVLFDGLEDVAVCQDLLHLLETASRRPGMTGELVAWRAPRFGLLRGDARTTLVAEMLQGEQSNSSVVYGERLILKLFRRVEMGLNPDLEISARLAERGFPYVPPLAGGIEYRRAGHEPWALAMAQGFVPNQGDAWRYTLRRLEPFLERIVEDPADSPDVPRLPDDTLCDAAERSIPSPVARDFGAFLSDAGRLGARTAQLHLELAAESKDPAFAPEPFSEDDRHSFAERAGTLARDAFQLLRNQLPRLPRETSRDAAQLLTLEPTVNERFHRLASGPIHAFKIRCHGDYHLGQILVAGDDFFIIDFEGEPARPLGERRNKQLAARDVAGMIRSFHYASCSAANETQKKMPQADPGRIENWTKAWYFWTSVAFLAAYRRTAAGAVFLPPSGQEFERLLDACLLEKAIYELRYELNNRPQWVHLPLQALRDLLGAAPHRT
jgi:trehalose synthase-fused probable maltokinase